MVDKRRRQNEVQRKGDVTCPGLFDGVDYGPTSAGPSEYASDSGIGDGILWCQHGDVD